MALYLLLSLLFLFLLYQLFKLNLSPKIKGAVGEYRVANKLKRLNKKEYIILNNLFFKTATATTQIDHLVICRSGIVVIETKYYKGWIHGYEKARYWTQTIYEHKTRFKNPIQQNWVHVFALKKILNTTYPVQYFPIVVFTGNATLKNISSELPVIYASQLKQTIKKLNDQKLLSYEQMQDLASSLQSQHISDTKITKQHSAQIRKKIQINARYEKQKVCPRCKIKLIKKKGRYGKFYGCVNFPECTYTLSRNA
ncbi:NERD domain-containing protein [Mesonia sediminis]|uniref:NERD domain-containing protein n=1 Tax=Mesonia sediminis TaxID=1703946 RepID=A0ABW5SIP5_9FLAO